MKKINYICDCGCGTQFLAEAIDDGVYPVLHCPDGQAMEHEEVSVGQAEFILYRSPNAGDGEKALSLGPKLSAEDIAVLSKKVQVIRRREKRNGWRSRRKRR